MERGSDKVSPRADEELKHRTQGLVRSGHTTHAEEWKDPEPPGEDQPEADRAPEGTLHGGVPQGMSGEDLDGRAELAGYLGKAAYPLVRAQVMDLVIDGCAPQRVIDLVRRLPSDRQFANVNDLWTAVGGHVEGNRF